MTSCAPCLWLLWLLVLLTGLPSPWRTLLSAPIYAIGNRQYIGNVCIGSASAMSELRETEEMVRKTFAEDNNRKIDGRCHDTSTA